MKKDGKYRFTLQFGADSEEQIRVGEFLESLGNKKSAVMVDVLNEYLASRPELQKAHGKIEVKVASGYNRDRMEQMIRQIVEEHIAKMQLTEIQADVPQNKIPETMEDDIAQMLDNLDLFQ